MMYLGNQAVGIAQPIFPAGVRESSAVLDASSTSIVFRNIEYQPYAYMYSYVGDADSINNRYMMLRGAAIKTSDNTYQGRQFCNRGGSTYATYDCAGSYDSNEKTFTITSGVNFYPNEEYKFWYITNELI